jgi:hypothetical protein
MDFNKAKLFLDKINREMSRMQTDQGQVAQIDVDILKSYIRDLYDVCLDESKLQQNVQQTRTYAQPTGPKTIAVTEEPKRAEPVRFTPERTPLAPPKPAPEAAKPEPVIAQPQQRVERVEPVVAPAPRPEPVVAAPKPEPAPQSVREVVEAEPAPAPSQRSGSASRKVLALFNLPEAKEISEKLARSPLADIKKGITLNDRLQWPSMLFGGDTAAFDAALNQINSLSSYDEAKDYLIEHFAERFDWANEHKDEVSLAFILLVGRRFGK